MAVVYAIALIGIPAINLSYYSSCNSTILQCTDSTSKTINTSMLGIGVGTSLFNTGYIILFQYFLMGGCDKILMYSTVPNCP